jgi:hypothetical protein
MSEYLLEDIPNLKFGSVEAYVDRRGPFFAASTQQIAGDLSDWCSNAFYVQQSCWMKISIVDEMCGFFASFERRIREVLKVFHLEQEKQALHKIGLKVSAS